MIEVIFGVFVVVLLGVSALLMCQVLEYDKDPEAYEEKYLKKKKRRSYDNCSRF